MNQDQTQVQDPEFAERLIAVGLGMAEVSHETRNALHRVYSILDEVERLRPHDESLLELTARLGAALDELSRLHEDILSYARVHELKLESCDLRELVTRAWVDLGFLRRDRDAELELGGDEAWCRADPLAMRQVFRNLLHNALTACEDPTRIEVSFRLVEGRGASRSISVVVRDNGPGIAPDDIERLFEPFYSQRRGGTGLGLPLARRLVHAHGGQLVAKAGDAGGELALELPTVPPLKAPTERAPKP